jgi:AraC family transcriptional regulator
VHDADTKGSDEPAPDSAIRLVNRATGRPFATARGPEILAASRTKTWWKSPLVFEVHRMSSHAYEEHTTDGHQLMVNLGGPVPIGWLEGATRRESVLRPDDLCIQSDGDSNAPRWGDTFTFATASLGRTALDNLLGEDAPPPTELFPKRHCVAAPAVAAFARTLAREIEAPTEPLYVETLVLALMLHLTATYGRASTRKGLSPQRRLGALQLRTVIDFTHSELSSRITLATMADTIGYSPYQFARMFKATTGRAPHQFVLSLRLERARRLLDVSGSVAGIALTTGFYDQAHLTNAFRKAYGMTPMTYIHRRSR